MKVICKCRNKQQAGTAIALTNALGEQIGTKTVVSDHHVDRAAHDIGRPEFFTNKRGEDVMSLRLFSRLNFEALCAQLCGGRLSKATS